MIESSSGAVIVVGAGPVGLWLAGELRLAGVATTVLERTEQRAPFTRGLGVHARTLEVLAMRSMAAVPLSAGRRLPRWHFGMLPSPVDFGMLDTEYPFVLAYPQQLLEDLLERRAIELGATILRGHTVTGIEQDETRETVVVTASAAPNPASTATGAHDGEASVSLEAAISLEAAFVVGCDGAGSTVRKAAGIAFPGTDTTLYAYLADATLDDPPAAGTATICGPGGTLIVAPLPGNRFRMSGFDPADQDPGRTLTEERVRASVARAAGHDFKLRDATWLSRFGNATRQAEHYRAGRVLIAGDAAHMHFPTGGVGLNVGIQDAMNLGWKLAAVAQGRAPLALLDSYEDERHPVGAALLENTLAQTALIANFTEEGLALRSYLAKLLDQAPALSAKLAGDLSGLEVAYPPTAPDPHPLTGRRTPNLRLLDETGQPDGTSLFETMGDARALLLTFEAAGSGTTWPDEAVTRRAEQLGIGLRKAQPWPGHEKTVAALIRPDGYVAWATDSAAGGEARGDAVIAALDTFGVPFPTAPPLANSSISVAEHDGGL
jgi:2-polyprenyl-6-methoxyphenol hydroxylase-like FAD-dependent oxidoreductase